MIIGLTGQTGAGKSTVSAVFAENGFFVINADLVSREVSSTKEAAALLRDAFGDGIFTDGALNRKALGKIVFSDPEKLSLLNKTVLPLISEKIKEIINSSDSEYILLDAPTLFESGLHKICDVIISVIAPENIRKERIMIRDSLSEIEASARISSQKSAEFFKENSDIILTNDKTVNDIYKRALKVIKSIKEKSV